MSMILGIYRIKTQLVADLKSKKVSLEDVLFQEILPTDQVLQLEKSWHGLHFLFAGASIPGPSSEVDSFLLSSHEMIGEDLGYGPARLIDPVAVKQIHKFLASKDENFVDQSMDIDQLRMHEVYPSIWDEDRSTLVEEYSIYFSALRNFVREATENDQALLLTMT